MQRSTSVDIDVGPGRARITRPAGAADAPTTQDVVSEFGQGRDRFLAAEPAGLEARGESSS